MYRISDLRGEKCNTNNFLSSPNLAATFEQQNLSPKEQFAIFAKGLVGTIGSCSINLTSALQFSIASECDIFHGDRLRRLPDPIPARNEIIPDPDSIPLSILIYPTGSKHQIDFAAYDASTPTVPLPTDGPDAM